MRLYDSDVTDEQWAVLEAHVKPQKRRGPKSRKEMRRVINGIFYRLRTGCQWRMLPKEYGGWEAIYGYWYRWSRNGLWEKINTQLRETLRVKAGKQAQPTAAVIDSQSVKTAQKGGAASGMMRGNSRKAANGTLR
jgi:putative transposase